MTNVIAVIDIGKTNKKIFLFNENFDTVYQNSTQFEEIEDEDGFPCDNIEAIELWVLNEIKKIQVQGVFKIKAINFSTHGASLIYLDKDGNRIAPLYNYLKPLDIERFNSFYKSNGGVEEFSRKTASPAYGMLNVGLQMLWIKTEKPEVWNKVHSILHYPQYLSFLFTKKIASDYTSVGAHTAIWDFDNMKYHNWLSDAHINLPMPTNGREAIITELNGDKVAVGTGLHDSSSSIIPVLEKESNFILLSTGTWIIAMNPYSTEKLTTQQLQNNCLCFMTPEKKQIKSSMQFLGRIHEVYLKALSDYFQVDINTHLELVLNPNLCLEIIDQDVKVFLAEGIDKDFEAHPDLLQKFFSYETAYYQLVYEISKKVIVAIDLILDKDSELSNIFVSGGFNRNEVFLKYLTLLKKNVAIKISECKNESALGAALLMKEYL
ncbi:FGGY family carbohydrate kinase [Algibacter mikhailovii]|uniref:FGGY family carbohydrate kinase n=1 Tax=Algibacter mikhailovii TaxID=425498 RepID=UPI0024949375|nr:FGGY family carbohydrate kinase [Algibacter mikhailovii]